MLIRWIAGMFIGARALIGFGIAFNFTAAPLLIMETAFPTHKVRFKYDQVKSWR
jgi:hypothetical protein